MHRALAILWLCTIAALGGCSGRPAPATAEAALATATPASAPSKSAYLIGRRGSETPESSALDGIAFKPFVPTKNPVAIALLPAFHGDDSRDNRGIGYEYRQDGRLFALSQWPAHGRSIAMFPAIDLQDASCPNVRAFPRGTAPGVVWMTPHGTVMTVQIDGESSDALVRGEWRRLVLRGACR